MRQMTEALKQNPAEIAATIGVTRRTVRRWISGVHKPNAGNRAKLKAHVETVWQEFNSHDHRWNAQRDHLLRHLTGTLMTPAEREQERREAAEMRAWFKKSNWSL